jgi:hypothetical protein
MNFVMIYLIVGEIVALLAVYDKAASHLGRYTRILKWWAPYAVVAVVVLSWPLVAVMWLLSKAE